MDKNRYSQFRNFVTNKYFEYCDECRYWKQVQSAMGEYIRANRWFLKKMFKGEIR